MIVEHLGIPDPVDLDDLRTTLTKAQWKPKGRHGIQLRAECGHPGTLEALREHSTRVDRLLRMVHRTADEDEILREALREIRLHVTAGEVRPTRGSDGQASFSSWTTRFRVDERRARELLMGEQLYRDRALAIRELYQNALDACRFRDIRERAMSQQFGRPYAYRGSIGFTQGKDEYGRHYIECRDNGVGMGREQLEGVFTQVGVRFTETAEFLEEQAQWADLPEPLKMYPNSRFGIGVVSYFMLADEIEVTTHRMERDGSLREPEYTVVIPGPGHFFRIKESPAAQATGPGTCVRLYLRDGENAPSCVRELRRFLGVADFPVTAEHGDQKESWEPGRLEPRQSLPPEQNGINAHGRLALDQEPPCDLVRVRRRPAGRRPAGELREAEGSVGQPV